jgi:hypothetical protein
VFNAGAIEPRILLSQKLIAQKQFEERAASSSRCSTRPRIAPRCRRASRRSTGRGRYQEAIAHDRLARRTKELRQRSGSRRSRAKARRTCPRTAQRRTVSLSRGAISPAVLTVPRALRAEPRHAADCRRHRGPRRSRRDHPRAALGLYDVDPVTRRVSPHRTLTAARLSQLLTRVLVARRRVRARERAGVGGVRRVTHS